MKKQCFTFNSDWLWEIFETTVKESTWGSSKGGGPLWVLDFRFKSLEKRFPDHPLIVHTHERYPLKEQHFHYSSNDKRAPSEITDHYNYEQCKYYRIISSEFRNLARSFVRLKQICNVLVFIDFHDGAKVVPCACFFSLLSFVKRVSETLALKVPEGASPCIVSDIVTKQSPKIMLSDYIWGSYWGPGFRDFFQLIEPFPCKYNCGPGGNGKDKFFLNYKPLQCYTKVKSVIPNLPAFRFDPNRYKFVKSVADPEVFIANIVYDFMELIGDRVWCSPKLPYPLMCYDDYKAHSLDDFLLCGSFSYRIEQLKINLPSVQNPNLWHKDFYPKEYWEFVDL